MKAKAGAILAVAFLCVACLKLLMSVQSWLSLLPVRKPEPRETLQAHMSGVSSVAFSPDGRTLASACFGLERPGGIKLWDAATGKEQTTLQGDSNFVSSLTTWFAKCWREAGGIGCKAQAFIAPHDSFFLLDLNKNVTVKQTEIRPTP